MSELKIFVEDLQNFIIGYDTSIKKIKLKNMFFTRHFIFVVAD